jgi:uncharacterized membrane protein YedE/YeeE
VESFLAERCPWYLAGLILTFVVVSLQWAANWGIGMTGALASTREWLADVRRAPDWRVFFVAGCLGGAWLHARLSGTYFPGFAYGSFDGRVGDSLVLKGLVLTGAGVLIGFGARRAGGCTSGHGLCGMSRLSGASVATTAIFMGTAVALAHAWAALGWGAR